MDTRKHVKTTTPAVFLATSACYLSVHLSMWSEAYKQAAIIPSAAGAALVAWLPAITAGGQTLFSPLQSIFLELKVGVYFFPGSTIWDVQKYCLSLKQQQIIFLPIIPYRTLP